MQSTSLVVDKIASVSLRCGLERVVQISPYVIAQEGYCVAVRALDEKTTYNVLECTDGSFQTLHQGDVIVGVLGERQALKGYSGRLPRQISQGDVLNVLNMGGIVGLCTSDHPELGPALRVEVLGAVLAERDGQLAHARIQDNALEPLYNLTASAPLVMVSGTSMNTGKTHAAARIIEGLTSQGLRVAAGKLTGASLMRDTRKMLEHGAVAAVSFTDAGVVASTNKEMGPLAKTLVAHLNAAKPDVIVLELGDGFIGYYGVDELLLDKELQRFTKVHVVAATDLAGTWAADQLFRQRYLAGITVVVGPVTDNAVGKQYIQNALGIPALNAIQDSDALTALVKQVLEVPESVPFRLRVAI